MPATGRKLVTLLFLLGARQSFAWNPVPPCPAPFPNTPVGETWCSNVIAVNPSTGVTVAEYGLPANATLITVATSSSVWYEEAIFFLGGGISGVFGYMAGANARNQSIIGNARTVPFIVRPLSPLASPAGSWMTSMLISTANYPEVGSIPPPNSSPDVRLELLGSHTFATLNFNFTNPPTDTLPLPPYFTYFLRCDEQLASGLPSGWVIKTDSSWTNTWLIYNGQDYAGTYTCSCLAEVEPSPTTPISLPPSTSGAKLREQGQRPQSMEIASLPQRRRLRQQVSSGPASAPPVCAVLLEFETYAWGQWAPPHSPNTVLPGIEGGTDGLAAIDVSTGTVYMATPADTPFFTLGLVSIDVATGQSRTIGNNWPLPPAGFSGVNGLFFSVDFDTDFGLVVGMSEISIYGPLPYLADEPGLPVGWTVVAAVDPLTSASTALTSDLTPALQAYPPLVNGVSGLDSTRGMLWLLTSTTNPLLSSRGNGSRATRHASWRCRNCLRPKRESDFASSSTFVGVQLATNPGAPSLAAIPALGGDFVVTSFKYSSAADALVSLEFNATGLTPNRPFDLANGLIVAYPVNGSAPLILGLVDAGKLNPGFQAEVSADGRFVYFAALQGSAAFESAALLTVDVVARTVATDLATPEDDYDVLALFKCVS